MNCEADILAQVRAGNLSLPPVELCLVDLDPSEEGRVCADATIEARWEGQIVRFLAEIRKLATPRSLRQAVAMARYAASPPETYPMVVVPYLSPGKIEELATAGVSGLDLCGNGVLVVPGQMLVSRSGQPNRFPQSVKLKNVYRGKNSLVARSFLIQPEFSLVKGILELLTQRGGSVALSTVSKALKRLEEDLVVSRQGDVIRLLQADMLLDKLADNYDPPNITERYCGKCDLPDIRIIGTLASVASGQQGTVVMTGSASAEKYATMAREPLMSLYTSLPPRELLERSGLAIEETGRFATLEILQTTDARVFFDPRIEDGVIFASPIQTYLELANGDKRQKDAAKQVRRGILASPGGAEDDDRP